MKRKVEENVLSPVEEIKNEEVPEKKLKADENKVTSKEERERFHHNLYRPPTADELNELRETEDLYKNNLFRMQISYLLEEVKVCNRKTSSIEGFLHSLHQFLNSLKSSEKHDMSDLSWLPSDVKFPMPDLPSKCRKGKFLFDKPSSIKVIGSYLLKTATKPNYSIDLAVGLPVDCLQAKDHLNFRYLVKRALYLTFLASKLKNWSEVETVEFTSMQNQTFKPILILKPAGKAGQKYTIKLYPMIAENVFKLSRFEPLKNNVRLSWYEGSKPSNNELSFPTPNHNASVLSDILFEQHLALLHDAISQCEGLKDAIPLLKVWLSQRGFTEGLSCFNGFQVSMLLAYLLKNSKITPHMSSYQIFRVTLLYLSNCDWTTSGISIAKDQHDKQTPSLEDFHAAYDVVFVDSTGYLNLCYNMEKTTFHQLQNHAKLAIESFQDSKSSNFDALFMKPSKFEENHDHWFSIRSSGLHEEFCSREESKLKMVDLGGNWRRIAIEKMISKLQKGLGQRINGLEVKQQKSPVWDVTSTPPKSSACDVTIGLRINTDHAEEILDMGPPADDPKAIEFRSFWGEKSDLRRFKDGSINEAVLWCGNNKAEKRLICKQVILYLLQRFFDIVPSDVTYFADQLDGLLRPNYSEGSGYEKRGSKSFRTSTGEEESLKIIYTLDQLSKQLRNMEQLPLDVFSIQGCHPVCRLTEVFPARISNHKWRNEDGSDFAAPSSAGRCPWIPTIDVVLQFEGSGKWPNDFEAIQNVKAAFYIKLASLLKAECSLAARASFQFVDVFKDGFCFRIKIFNQREVHLCKQPVANETTVIRKRLDKKGRDLDVEMVKRPLHTTMIHSLSQRFAAYGVTSRVAKRWVSAQLLCDHVNEETIELIVASLFLMPMPNHCPSSHIAGFLRFLTVIANHDWENESLIVDLNETLTAQDFADIRENFTNNRKNLPPMFIATPYDKEVSIWTKENLTSKILSRLKVLAKLSRDVLEAELYKPKTTCFKQIFRPPLDDYNVLIQLDVSKLPRRYQAVDSTVKLKPPKDKSNPKGFAIVDFDPATLYLNELRSTFSEVALFFYDKYGGSVIGVVWKPNATNPQSFKILALKYQMPSTYQPKEKTTSSSSSSHQYLEPNIGAILEDFQIIGKGLVTNVVVQKT